VLGVTCDSALVESGIYSGMVTPLDMYQNSKVDKVHGDGCMHFALSGRHADLSKVNRKRCSNAKHLH